MAKNDVVLLDALLSQQNQDSNDDIGQVFERFVLEQVLKNYDLSNEEIEAGWTDGSLDGGIDGFYILVNGLLVTDTTDFAWPRSGAEITVYLITCKHKEGFQQVALDAMLASVQELFDLSISTHELTGSYSKAIKQCRETFITTYQQLALYRPQLTFEVVYASRGDASKLGESIIGRSNQLTTLLCSYFSASNARFTTLDASDLVELHRQVKSFALDLPVQECLTANQEGYVVLARLHDYSSFVSDEKGQLRRYLFDSNVRAYLGTNLVNKDIAETLENIDAPNFWWLNNGVTILATSASLVGKTLKLKDIQIVNGLQTTESIYRHYSVTKTVKDDLRSLLVKIIVSQEENVRDQVIRATNNQSVVEPAALHATDKIQRNIEEILLRHDWYYERRTNFYKNEGRPEVRIISPLLLATGSVALLLKNPAKSSRLRQKHLRTPEAYQLVYFEDFPLEAWPVVATLIRGSENALVQRFVRKNLGGRGQYLSTWRGPLAYLVAVRILKTFSYTHRELASIDISHLSDAYFAECLHDLSKAAMGLSSSSLSPARFERVLRELQNTWTLNGELNHGLRQLPSRLFNPNEGISSAVAEEFLASVNKQLPPQPWAPGLVETIASVLLVTPNRVSNAMLTLISRGVWVKQKDGVLFDELSGSKVRYYGLSKEEQTPTA